MKLAPIVLSIIAAVAVAYGVLRFAPDEHLALRAPPPEPVVITKTVTVQVPAVCPELPAKVLEPVVNHPIRRHR